MHTLKKLLDIEGTEGIRVPYQGYVEVELDIPEVAKFKRDVLLLVIEDSSYGQRVPIQVGTLHIDMILDLASSTELAALGITWERGSLGRRIVGKQLSDMGFSLDQVKGPIKLADRLQLSPGETIRVRGVTKLKGHTRRVNVVTEPIDDSHRYQSISVITVPTYTFCKPGSNRAMVVLRNLTNETITLQKGRVIEKLMAANLVPNKLAPKYVLKTIGVRSEDAGESKETLPVAAEKTPEKEKAVVETRVETWFLKLDLDGIKEWSQDNQEAVRKVLADHHDIFALDNLELGRTDLVKHTIKLSDPTPFKERYRHIPPHQFEEVRKHLKEMEEIGAIRRSNSPWASPVVLVRKKDGSLRFCIDLQKLNERTVKDAYSLPRIEESLDCLNGARIFTSLDLKSGYWQEELDEESIPLTAFTVGPLGFYECIHMPFGLTNAPATFQRLMESCLGDLHLNWCIIYLDDVIIHSKSPEEHIERLKGVFHKLRKAGLKLKPSKCKFFKD